MREYQKVWSILQTSYIGYLQNILNALFRNVCSLSIIVSKMD